MNVEEFNVEFVLEMKYKKIFNLPLNWDKIDIHNKCEFLGMALNRNIKIEELEEYKEYISND